MYPVALWVGQGWKPWSVETLSNLKRTELVPLPVWHPSHLDSESFLTTLGLWSSTTVWSYLMYLEGFIQVGRHSILLGEELVDT